MYVLHTSCLVTSLGVAILTTNCRFSLGFHSHGFAVALSEHMIKMQRRRSRRAAKRHTPCIPRRIAHENPNILKPSSSHSFACNSSAMESHQKSSSDNFKCATVCVRVETLWGFFEIINFNKAFHVLQSLNIKAGGDFRSLHPPIEEKRVRPSGSSIYHHGFVRWLSTSAQTHMTSNVFKTKSCEWNKYDGDSSGGSSSTSASHIMNYYFKEYAKWNVVGGKMKNNAHTHHQIWRTINVSVRFVPFFVLVRRGGWLLVSLLSLLSSQHSHSAWSIFCFSISRDKCGGNRDEQKKNGVPTCRVCVRVWAFAVCTLPRVATQTPKKNDSTTLCNHKFIPNSKKRPLPLTPSNSRFEINIENGRRQHVASNKGENWKMSLVRAVSLCWRAVCSVRSRYSRTYSISHFCRSVLWRMVSLMTFHTVPFACRAQFMEIVNESKFKWMNAPSFLGNDEWQKMMYFSAGRLQLAIKLNYDGRWTIAIFEICLLVFNGNFLSPGPLSNSESFYFAFKVVIRNAWYLISELRGWISLKKYQLRIGISPAANLGEVSQKVRPIEWKGWFERRDRYASSIITSGYWASCAPSNGKKRNFLRTTFTCNLRPNSDMARQLATLHLTLTLSLSSTADG